MARRHQQRLQADAARSKGTRPLTGALSGAILALIAFTIIFLTGCGLPAPPAVAEAAELNGVPAPSQETAARSVDESGYLAQALRQMPAGARRFAFTHWARVHAHNGFEGNSQVTGRDERVAYMLDVMNQTQPAAQLDSTHFLFQEQNWGWDSTDLLWEAEAEWDRISESVHLLQFRPDFDFAPLRQLLAQRGFRAGDYHGVTVYNVPLSENPDWHYRSHLAHHSFAFLADGLVVMAPTAPAVERVLDAAYSTGEPLAAQPQLASLLPELAQMMAVEVQFGEGTCEVYGNGDGALSPYALLAAGHRSGGTTQEDVLLLAYDEGAEAAADLAGRRALLQSGASGQRATNYGDVFQLEEASVEGHVQTFVLSPTEELRRDRPGWPQTLLGWAQDGDALFAGCGAAGERGVSGIE